LYDFLVEVIRKNVSEQKKKRYNVTEAYTTIQSLEQKGVLSFLSLADSHYCDDEHLQKLCKLALSFLGIYDDYHNNTNNYKSDDNSVSENNEEELYFV